MAHGSDIGSQQRPTSVQEAFLAHRAGKASSARQPASPPPGRAASRPRLSRKAPRSIPRAGPCGGGGGGAGRGGGKEPPHTASMAADPVAAMQSKRSKQQITLSSVTQSSPNLFIWRRTPWRLASASLSARDAKRRRVNPSQSGALGQSGEDRGGRELDTRYGCSNGDIRQCETPTRMRSRRTGVTGVPRVAVCARRAATPSRSASARWWPGGPWALGSPRRTHGYRIEMRSSHNGQKLTISDIL